MAGSRGFLVVVLVVTGLLAILFLLGISGTFELPKPNVRALSRSFGGRHLQPGDLSAESARSCAVTASTLQIPAHARCSLMAPASSDPVWRRRSVLLRTHGDVKVTVTPVGDGSPVEGQPDAGEDAEFPIAREGARLDLACLAAARCTVTWQR